MLADIIKKMSSVSSLINVLNSGINYVNWNIAGTGTTKGATGIHFVANAGNDIAKINLNLKNNTVYTLIYRVTASTSNGLFFAMGSDLGVNTAFSTSNQNLPKTVGWQKVLFTTANPIIANLIDFRLNAGNTDGTYIDFTDVMIIEGDQRSNPATDVFIPY